MKNNGSIQPPRTRDITVLSVSPHEDDHAALRRLLGHSRWVMFAAKNTSTARTLLEEHDISVVVCESDLHAETWVDMLGHLQGMPTPPSLIVTSRLADDRLWSEVLNIGGYDVLAKPFDSAEVMRSIRYAWEHTRFQAKSATKPMRSMSAAS